MASANARQPASPSSRPPASTSIKSTAENIKDTLESIVVAFIMAFVFRAFIVEAFVIPTGSMADTLYGAQYLNTCSTCGYQYALGASPPIVRYKDREGFPLVCPNCNTRPDKIPPEELSYPNSGDRILVHKWPFYMPGDTLGPQRWKVTVFKDPNDGVTNFIKRLVGMPGEVLQIIEGDVYTASIDALNEKDPQLVKELDDLRKAVYEFRFDQSARRGRSIQDRYEKAALEVLPYLRIQRKLPEHETAQKSLWFNVYDNDFLPNFDSLHIDQDSVACWKPSSDEAAEAWHTRQRKITFSSASPTPLAIEFSGKHIVDFYAYNADGIGPNNNVPVGDLCLQFTWLPHQGGGGLALRMNRDRDEFIAHLNLDGTVSLERRRIARGRDEPLEGRHREEEIGRKNLDPFMADQAYEIEFINVDYRVCVKVNGREILATTDDQYHPDPDRLADVIESRILRDRPLEPLYSEVTIAGHNMQCTLRHVDLQRDVYYRSPEQLERLHTLPTLPPGTLPGQGEEEANPYLGWQGWGTEGMPILLRRQRVEDGRKYGGEFFMLGDNSPASKDSRLWWQIGPHLVDMGSEYQVGTVPRDQLIGEAFFVYWPSGYRGSWFPRIGVVPNFGRMRWIR